MTSERNYFQKTLDPRLQELNNVAQDFPTMSPMQALAPEMLLEIFSWTAPELDDVTIPPSNGQSPWNIARVSSKWRAISLSLPSIWSNIYVRGRLLPRAVKALKVQLERSNPYLLSVIFASDAAAFNLLLDHSMRWKTAELTLEKSMIPALDRISGRLPELRRFKLDYTGARAGASACRVFETAPKLSEAIILGDPSLPLPFAQLIRARVRISLAPQVLASGHHLLQLSLHGLPDTPDSPVELPRLRMLLVGNGEFLKSLILPELEELLIAAHCLPAIPMIRRSQCRLRKLCLIRCSVEEGLAVLDGIPTLVELRWPASKELLARMIDCPSVVPELRAMWLLQFESFKEEKLPTLNLVELMESRRSPPLSLRVLDFIVVGKSSDMVELETNLQRQGIDAECLNRRPSLNKHAEYTNTYP
ncbi:hypothetical protein FB451DRAFT_142459 [Mycena latifolia]|nr:hypothetical protein FB451DRAFT_142459 [Mycena latifolia]